MKTIAEIGLHLVSAPPASCALLRNAAALERRKLEYRAAGIPEAEVEWWIVDATRSSVSSVLDYLEGRFLDWQFAKIGSYSALPAEELGRLAEELTLISED